MRMPYLLVLAGLASFPLIPSRAAQDYPVTPVPFTKVKFTSGLLHDRQATNVAVTLGFALDQLESSKRTLNFDLAAETLRRRAAGESTFQNKPVTDYPFDDSDVYKVIEGAAFCLAVQPDDDLHKRLEALIARIAAAQEPDGYLYTWRTMHPDTPVHPWIGKQRWEKDPDLSHELYNLGHLYEAAYAYERATGSRTLLNISLKSAELLWKDFGDGKLRIPPGHQVIEMGLAKLFRATGDERWLKLADLFLQFRGGGSDYSQNHQPVLDQTAAVGHAVRANYMYSGMADIAAMTGNARYLKAIDRIWENVVTRKMHLTGGCGARGAGEAYGDDYELPHRCYNETCANIAFMFWNHRMFLMTGEGKYMDVLERALYNSVLSGVSLSGDHFFYPNPLEYDGKEKNNHGHAGRAPWFGCACCPPNILRLIASLGGYAAAVRDDRLYLNLYAQSELECEIVGTAIRLEQETTYPWNGDVRLTVRPGAPARFKLCLRLPGWVRGAPVPGDLYAYADPSAASWTIRVNDQPADAVENKGYLEIERDWVDGDVVMLDLPMLVRRVTGHPAIEATRGRQALERGPVVYAVEGVDNDGSVFDLFLPEAATATDGFDPDQLGGVTVLTVADAARAVRNAAGEAAASAAVMKAIPYACWANRGLSPMQVWLPVEASGARLPPVPTIASSAKLSVSFARGGMDPSRVNDQLMPRNATDGFAPNFDFWPHKGSQEWLAYEFAQPTPVKAVTVSWFDDTGTGECRLPASWRLLYKAADDSWQPVEAEGAYDIRKAEPVRLPIKPVTTRALRLEVQLPDGFSAGLYEWVVE